MNNLKALVYHCVIPLAGACIRRKKKEVPVIYYHDVTRSEKGSTFARISLSKLILQIEWLCKQGYQFLRFSDIKEFIPAEKQLLLVFDDGNRSVYELIFNFMKSNGVAYNIFFPPGVQEKQPDCFLTWSMVETMVASGLVEFGAHTYDHIDARKIDKTNWERQIVMTNDIIAKHTGQIPRDFCFPCGLFDQRIVKLLSNAGTYDRLYTSMRHFDKQIGTVLLKGRIAISDDDSMRIFKNKVRGNYFTQKIVLERLRQ